MGSILPQIATPRHSEPKFGYILLSEVLKSRFLGFIPHLEPPLGYFWGFREHNRRELGKNRSEGPLIPVFLDLQNFFPTFILNC